MSARRKPPESVLLTLQRLADATPNAFSARAGHLALQRVVNLRPCPLCDVQPGQWCRTYGWTNAVMRTHPARLRMTASELRRTALWALREEERLRQRQQLEVDMAIDQDDVDAQEEDDERDELHVTTEPGGAGRT